MPPVSSCDLIGLNPRVGGRLEGLCPEACLYSCSPVSLLSQRKYQEDFENLKDQIYFMQTETPEYKMNKQAGIAASKV